MESGYSSRLQLLQPEMAGQLLADLHLFFLLELANSVVMHMHLPTPDHSLEASFAAIDKMVAKSLLRYCF